jgi:hypothetical protein
MSACLLLLATSLVASAAEDDRVGRDDPTLSVGPLLRTDRGKPASVKSGIAVQAEMPVIWRFNIRGDFMSGQDALDDLRVQGPKAAVMAVYHQPIDIWGVDVGIGPGAWFGKSAWWDSKYPGPWPGYRFAVGGTYRPHPWVGARMEFGVDQHFGTYPLVNGSTAGWDLRLMATMWIP